MSSFIITVNKASEDELRVFLENHSLAFNPPFADSVDVVNYAHKLRTHATTVELYEKECMVGLLAAYINTTTTVAYIPYICVSPTSSGLGLGGKLLDALAPICNDCCAIELEVRITNTSAIRFYKRKGFQIIETRSDKYYMRKKL